MFAGVGLTPLKASCFIFYAFAFCTKFVVDCKDGQATAHT